MGEGKGQCDASFRPQYQLGVGPSQIWPIGGCGNLEDMPAAKKAILTDKVYTVKSCNAACGQQEWCTHFFLGRVWTVKAGECILIVQGCTYNAEDTNYAYYRAETSALGQRGTDSYEWALLASP